MNYGHIIEVYTALGCYYGGCLDLGFYNRYVPLLILMIKVFVILFVC